MHQIKEIFHKKEIIAKVKRQYTKMEENRFKLSLTRFNTQIYKLDQMLKKG